MTDSALDSWLPKRCSFCGSEATHENDRGRMACSFCAKELEGPLHRLCITFDCPERASHVAESLMWDDRIGGSPRMYLCPEHVSGYFRRRGRRTEWATRRIQGVEN